MFYITISNGLLKDGHRKRMGSAVWEFMWCMDKVTRIDKDGFGFVLGGKPIKLDEIAKDLGVHRDTISENLISLEENGYIVRTVAPYGIIIKVARTKKRFGENTEPVRGRGSEKTPNLVGKTPNLIKTVSDDKINTTATVVAKDFSLKEEVQKLEDSQRRDLNIIALFLEKRKPDLRTKEQLNTAIRRHIRPAGQLKPFTDEQILGAIPKAKKLTEEWTLETVLKVLTK